MAWYDSLTAPHADLVASINEGHEGGTPWPWTNNGGSNNCATWSNTSAGTQPYRVIPGPLNFGTPHPTGGAYRGLIPWVEGTSATDHAFDHGSIDCRFEVAHIGYALIRDTGSGPFAEVRVNDLGLAGRHAFVWEYHDWGTFDEDLSAAGLPLVGFPMVSSGGKAFGQAQADMFAPGGTGRIRVHGWGDSYASAFFSGTAETAAPAGFNVSIIGAVWWCQVRKVGADAATTDMRMICGLDMLFADLGFRPGMSGRGRVVTEAGVTITGTTLSESELTTYSSFLADVIPGYTAPGGGGGDGGCTPTFPLTGELDIPISTGTVSTSLATTIPATLTVSTTGRTFVGAPTAYYILDPTDVPPGTTIDIGLTVPYHAHASFRVWVGDITLGLASIADPTSTDSHDTLAAEPDGGQWLVIDADAHPGDRTVTITIPSDFTGTSALAIAWFDMFGDPAPTGDISITLADLCIPAPPSTDPADYLSGQLHFTTDSVAIGDTWHMAGTITVLNAITSVESHLDEMNPALGVVTDALFDITGPGISATGVPFAYFFGALGGQDAGTYTYDIYGTAVAPVTAGARLATHLTSASYTGEYTTADDTIDVTDAADDLTVDGGPGIFVQIGVIGSTDLFIIGESLIGGPDVIGGIERFRWVDVPEVQPASLRYHGGAQRFATPFFRAEAGSLSFTIDNADGSMKYDPLNLAGPYVVLGRTELRPGLPVRVILRKADDTEVSLWRGKVDHWNPDYGDTGTFATVQVTGVDPVGGLQPASAAGPAPLQGENEHAAPRINRILDHVGWPDHLRDIDATKPGATLTATDLTKGAWPEIQLTQDSDYGFAYIDHDGRVAYRPRSARPAEPSLTFGGAGNEYGFDNPKFSFDPEQHFNIVKLARVGGVPQTKTNPDSAHRLRDGPRMFERSDLICNNDYNVRAIAGAVLYEHGELKFRLEQITVRLLRGVHTRAAWLKVLRAPIGARIRVLVPAPDRVVTQDALIRGYDVTVDVRFVDVVFSLQHLPTEGNAFIIGESLIGGPDVLAPY